MMREGCGSTLAAGAERRRREQMRVEGGRLARMQAAIEGGRWDEALEVADEAPEDSTLAAAVQAVHGIKIVLGRMAVEREVLERPA